MNTEDLTEPKTTVYLTKSFLIALASILIPPIISLVLLVIFQFVAGASDIYGCSGCECNYRITRDCWGRYGESGWLYALLIILFEWFIKLLMVIISLVFLVGEFSKRKNNSGWIATMFLIVLNPVLSIFVAIATHLYGEVARSIHLLIYGCGCFTGG